MTPKLSIEFTPGAQAVLTRLHNLPRQMMVVVGRTVDEVNGGLTIPYIQRRLMSHPKHGPVVPDGLRAKSNRLRNSIRASKCVIVGESVVGGIGSNVKYASVHEFGFNGTVNVRAHTRKVLVGTATRYVTTEAGRKSKKKIAVHGTDQVRAHTRKMNLPARRLIYNGIVANLPNYSRMLSDAIVNLATKGA